MKRLFLSIIMLLMLFASPPIEASGQSHIESRLEHARKVIFDQYGESVYVKNKILRKFGRNPDVSTAEETVWNVGGKEVYPTGNDITKFSSSSASDNIEMTFEGHTRHNDIIYFRVQRKSLNGQTPVLLDSPLYRLTRAYNNNGTDLVGDIYAYRTGTTVTAGVPQELDSVHIKVTAADNQSLKASTTISTYDYWIITEGRVSVGKAGGQDRKVQFRLHIREQDKIFRTYDVLTTSNAPAPFAAYFDPPIIVPAGADIHVDAISSGAGTEVSATLAGYLAAVNN